MRNSDRRELIHALLNSGGSSDRAEVPEREVGSELPRVDEVDLRILSLLRADSRMSARALARAIGMSPGAVSERVGRLESAGVIRGYSAEIDWAAVGLGMSVMIGLQTQQGHSLALTEKMLLAIPEVRSVLVVSGQWDLVVFVQVRDHLHLRDVVLEKVWSIPGFRHSETMLVLETFSRAFVDTSNL